jgi:hypothetical protein
MELLEKLFLTSLKIMENLQNMIKKKSNNFMKLRRIKAKNKLKRYIAVHLAIIVTLFMPMVTLTSCSNISQHLIPISTNTNPYDGSKVLDPFIENGQYEESTKEIEDNKKNII